MYCYISNSTDTILEITPLKCKEITSVIGVMVSPGNSTHASGIRAKVKVVKLIPKEASLGGSGGMLPRKILHFEMLFGGTLGCNTVCRVLASFQHQRYVMIYQRQIQGGSKGSPLWKSFNSIHNSRYSNRAVKFEIL